MRASRSRSCSLLALASLLAVVGASLVCGEATSDSASAAAAAGVLKRLAARIANTGEIEAHVGAHALPLITTKDEFEQRHCGLDAECTANEKTLLGLLSLDTLKQIDTEIKDTWNWKGPGKGTQGWKHMITYQMMLDKQALIRLDLLRKALAALAWPNEALRTHAAAIDQCLTSPGIAAALLNKRAATPAEVSVANLPLLVRSVTQAVLAVHTVVRSPTYVDNARYDRVPVQRPAYRCAYSCWEQVRRATVGTLCTRFQPPVSRRQSPSFAVGGVSLPPEPIVPPKDENENIWLSAAGWGNPAYDLTTTKGVTMQVSNGRLSTFIPGSYQDYVAARTNLDENRTQQRRAAGCYILPPPVVKPVQQSNKKPKKTVTTGATPKTNVVI